MCLYKLHVSRCGHLSRTYKNAAPCAQLFTQCRANPNGETLPHLYLSKPVATPPPTAAALTTAVAATTSSLSLLPLSFSDPEGKAVVTFAPNLRTKCAWCEPAAYARMMEREEGVEHRKAAAADAVARREMAAVMGAGVMDELDAMIAEGFRRGWGDEVEDDAAAEEMSGAKKKGVSSSKAKAATVRFLDEDLPLVLLNGVPIDEVK